jgi:hypothetical protein
MATKQVTFEIDAPDHVDDHQLEEGLEFYLQIRANISMHNPLSECEISELNPRNLQID